MQHLQLMLLERLHRHEAHPRTLHGFAHRLRIAPVIFVALYEGRDVLRGDQSRIVPQTQGEPRPVMRTTARLHAHYTRRQTK